LFGLHETGFGEYILRLPPCEAAASIARSAIVELTLRVRSKLGERQVLGGRCESHRKLAAMIMAFLRKMRSKSR
jgi:hypothetical protein